MNDAEKLLRVHSTLIRGGVDPDYAEAEALKAADRLEDTEPAKLAAELLEATPARYRKDADPMQQHLDRIEAEKRATGAYRI